MRYQLTLTEKQAQIISQALEVVSRIGIGQIRDALELLPVIKWHEEGWFNDVVAIESILSKYNKNKVDGYNRSLSISGEKTDERAKIAYELHQVIRRALTWVYDDPLVLTSEPLATVKKISEE